MAFLRDPRGRSAAPPPNIAAAIGALLIVIALLSSLVMSGAAILNWAAAQYRTDVFDQPPRRATHGAVP